MAAAQRIRYRLPASRGAFESTIRRDYVELMAHFDAALPGREHRVIYEQMIDDTEGEIRRLLQYCNVSFEDACLRFFENDRAVRTASSEQVRQPIFPEGMDQC